MRDRKRQRWEECAERDSEGEANAKTKEDGEKDEDEEDDVEEEATRKGLIVKHLHLI